MCYLCELIECFVINHKKNVWKEPSYLLDGLSHHKAKYSSSADESNGACFSLFHYEVVERIQVSTKNIHECKNLHLHLKIENQKIQYTFKKVESNDS